MIAPDPNSTTPESHPSNSSYSEILSSLDIPGYFQAGYYLQSAPTILKQGWILHITVIRLHFQSLMEKLVPILKRYNVVFKIPLNENVHQHLLNGTAGYTQLGKIICIYSEDQKGIQGLAMELIPITENLRGPDIPTDLHLGGLVFTRYGSFSPALPIEKRYIINNNGNQIEDEYNIPFKILPWLDWPFKDIAASSPPKMSNILNDAYLLKEIIKNDARGRVIIGLYKKSFLNYKKCIVKEAKYAMATDNEGRDAIDRLNWQKEVLEDISGKIPIPRLIDYFNAHHNNYLVMEFIKGISINTVLENIIVANSWLDLSPSQRMEIIDYLIKIIDIVNKLHNKGYIHRDLNVGNFLITNSGQVYIIDFELAYNTNKNAPSPPFTTGTIGYMSPEQAKGETPDRKQDIYSIGALISVSLIRVQPHKFNIYDSTTLNENLKFFIGNKLASLITRCVNIDPLKRPDLEEIRSTLVHYKQDVSEISKSYSQEPVSTIETIIETIKNATASLSNPVFLNDTGIWTSRINQDNQDVENSREDLTIYPGFYQGISGILYYLGTAAQMGIEIGSCKDIIFSNLNFLKEHLPDILNNSPAGFFLNATGIGLGIASLIKGRVVPENSEINNLMQKCFAVIPKDLDVINGIAGYGIALLKYPDLTSTDFFISRLNHCIKTLLETQLPDGSWPIEGKPVGFYNGTAGICTFLLEYSVAFNNDKAKLSSLKGINWLIKKGKKSGKKILWKKDDTTIKVLTIHNGIYIMALPFIRAYEVTRNEMYKIIAETVLLNYPDRIVMDNFTQQNGLAGLGDIYIEAYKAFKDPKWLARAQWIADVLIHTTFNAYWALKNATAPGADLIPGNTGIMHFLLHFTYRDKMNSIFSSKIKS